jgi:hypothetical protein
MEGLVFKAGGRLECLSCVNDEETDTGEDVRCDVTECAAAYLLEPAYSDGEVYVRDIFSLLDANPVLLQVFERQRAAAYLKEAEERNDVPYTGEYDPEGTEYLELFHYWENNSGTGELTRIHRLWIRGVGDELRDDVKRDGGVEYKKGTRIQWAIKLSPVNQLMNLPLCSNVEVSVTEDDSNSERYHQELHTFVVKRPWLAQVIHALLWELSYGGTLRRRANSFRRCLIQRRRRAGPWTREQ